MHPNLEAPLFNVGSPIRIALCIVTYRRQESLARLLRSLGLLRFDVDQPEIRVIVVDNDASGSAGNVVEDFRKECAWPILYDIEPARGIAQARNRAIQLAGNDLNWIAFVDDDEEVEPFWLNNLMQAQRKFCADVVVGPKLMRFDATPPHWIEHGHSSYRKRYPSGKAIPVANTGNVLIRNSLLKDFPTPFNLRFGLIGGSDRHFFQRVHMAGYRIVWANDAIVHEWIPASRAKARWLIKRRFRVGSSVSLIERDLTPTFAALIKRIVKALGSMGIGISLLLGGIFRGRHVLLKGTMWFAYGSGMIAGLFGFSYREYLSAGETPKAENQEHDSA